jgi:hypothetical protein
MDPKFLHKRYHLVKYLGYTPADPGGIDMHQAHTLQGMGKLAQVFDDVPTGNFRIFFKYGLIIHGLIFSKTRCKGIC